MKGFMFYNHFAKVITRLTLEEKGRFLDCLLNYYNDKAEPAVDTPIVVDIAFKAVQPDIDRYIKSCTSKMKKNKPIVVSEPIEEDYDEQEKVAPKENIYSSPFVKVQGE